MYSTNQCKIALHAYRQKHLSLKQDKLIVGLMLSSTQVQGGGGRGDDDVLVRLPPDLREVLDLQVRRKKKQHIKQAKNYNSSCSSLCSYNSSESGGSNNGQSSIESRSCTLETAGVVKSSSNNNSI